MKDTINRLARGSFDYEPPVIEISEANIDEKVGINSIYCGKLRIKSVFGQQVKGIVSSSNHAVVMEKSTFVGVDNEVTYRVDTRGIGKGEKIEGRFNVVSSGGEASVTFSFRIVDNSVESSLGSLKNLFHFTNLVQTEPDEAYKLFVSEQFENIFLKDDLELRNRYELLLYGDKPRYLGPKTDVKQCVEEFLVSIRKKSRVHIEVSDNKKEYHDIANSMVDSFVITKNTWGAVSIKVTSDNPCVVPDVEYIDEERFAGNRYELRYFIDKDKLHAGRNYARITLESLFQTLSVDMVLNLEDGFNDKVTEKIEIQKNIVFLMESYISFRTKKINMSQWTKQSLTAIEKIRSFDSEDRFYKLLHAQLLIAVRKREDAKWLLENVREYVIGRESSEAVLYAYYLYVNSLHSQNTTYSVDALKSVRHLYEDGNDDWRILWIMFYLDEEYKKNKSLKLVRIKEQFYKGCVSPVMYLEAAQIFAEQPMLLRVFDEFEVQTVMFACRTGILSEKLLNHIIEIAENRKTFSKTYWKMMIMLYDKKKDNKLLSVIYKLMMKSDTMPKDCFKWIKAAVDADLRITNLYENYLKYCDRTSMKPLPKLLLFYFRYNSSLDYNLKAYLYANVYHNRYDDPQTFDEYRYQIEKFVISQVSQGHISTHLAMLYKDMLEPSMINADTSKMITNILFGYRIQCDNPDVSVVYVKHKENEEIQVKPLVNGEAYINIYTQGAGIVLGDRRGHRYTGEGLFTCEKLFDGDKYIPIIFKYLKDDLWVSLYLCENGRKYGYNDSDMAVCYRNLVGDTRVAQQYRNGFLSKIIDYYYTDYDGEDFENDYIYPDVDQIDEDGRIKVTETYIINGMYDKAMDIIRKRGAIGVNPKRLLRMCASLIDQVDGERDEEVLAICDTVFKQHKYDEAVLSYLVKYYECSTKEMVELWKAARNFDIKTNDLEERLLYQMMFTRTYNPAFSKIFENYYNHGARERLVEAYLSYNSYLFFVKNTVVDTDMFRIIEHRLIENVDTIDVCKLALLKFYSDDIETIELTEGQIKLAGKVMDEMIDKKIIFEFYKKFARVMNVPHSVMDRTMVEYRTNPNQKVMIHYIMADDSGNGEYMVENMENVFEGIFVKSIVLFYGDNMQYYVTEHKDGAEELTESGNICNQTMSEEFSQGRYDMINDMLACVELQDVQTLKKMMNRYIIAQKMADELFKPL